MLKPGLTSAGGSSIGCGWPARWPAPTSSSSTTRSRRSTGSGSRPAVRIIQLWHAAGAFKTVGYSRVGPARPERRASTRTTPPRSSAPTTTCRSTPRRSGSRRSGSSRPASRGWTASSTRGAGRGSGGRPRGLPRDVEGRITILFAPTYRGDTIREASYDFELLDYAALHALAVERDAVVIIKMHPFVREPLRIPEAFRDRLLDGSTRPTSTSTTCCSRSTSWSPTIRRSCSSSRPSAGRCCSSPTTSTTTSATRDFYVPFESFVPGRIVRTFPEMLDAIRRDDYQAEKVADFAARALRPSRQRLDRPGHRPADPGPVRRPDERSRPDHPDRARPRGVRVRAPPAAPARGSCSRPPTPRGSAATWRRSRTTSRRATRRSRS